MESVLQRTNSLRRFAGIAMVAGGHIAIVLGLMHGLARNHVKFNLPAPIDWVAIVQSVPPVQRLPKPMPVAQQVVDVVVPRDVALDMPPTLVDTIAVPRGDSPAPAVDAGHAMSGPVDNTGTADSGSLGVACPNAQAVRSTLRYPAQARREGVQGDVLARFVVGANGEIRDINIVRTANRALNAAVVGAVKQFNCIDLGRDVSIEVPFSFRLE